MSLFSQLRLWLGSEPEETGATVSEVNVHLRFRAELDLMKDDIELLREMYGNMLKLMHIEIANRKLAPREIFEIKIDDDPGVICLLSRHYTQPQADEIENRLIELVEHIRAGVVDPEPVKLDEIGVDEPKAEAAE